MIVRNKLIKATLNVSGKYLHSPEQRLILGATALATQPFIDMHNKNIDEETRKTSVARTLAKIVAGTIVGVLVREAGIKYIERYSKYLPIYGNKAKGILVGIKREKGRSCFVPVLEKIAKNGKSIFPIEDAELTRKFVLYRKAFGTFVATIAMIGTNFLLDAPLTKYFTEVFQKKIDAQMPKKEKKSSEVHK